MSGNFEVDDKWQPWYKGEQHKVMFPSLENATLGMGSTL